MKNKFFALLILCLCIGGCSRKHPPPTQKSLRYFSPVAVVKFTGAGLPCLPIQVGDKTIVAELDLGFRGNFSFSNEILHQIEGRKHIKSTKMHTFRGTEYGVEIYEIPSVKIGEITFYNPTFQTTAATALRNQGAIPQNGEEPSQPEEGSMGWELFRSLALFLDLGNSQIIFCDSLETLKNHGYPIETFTKTPLISEKGLIEFKAITPNGPLVCVLDTGATWNVLNTELPSGKSIEQMAWDPQNESQIPISIDGKDFDIITFHNIPINIPVKVEAMLGMEFFKNHQVFIDFGDNQLYFAPAKSKI